MNPLSQNNCRTLLSAVEKIYSPTDIDQFPSTILSAMREVLSCNTICYNEISIPESRMSWITDPVNALPGPTLREMFNRHLHEHPLIAHSGLPNTTRSLRISDFLSRQQFHRLALYNEYYRPLGVEYQLGTTISISERHILGVGLDRDCLDFSENERLCLDLLRPHLIQSYRNLQILKLMKRKAEGSVKQLVVVNRTGQVQLINDDVWRIFANYFDMPRFHRSLPDVVHNWIKYERARLCQESDVSSPPVPLVISKEGGKITIHFLWGGKDSEQDIIIIEEEPTDIASASMYGSKLTRRETEILAWLSQGKTNAEIGLALSISPRTVKKHLEHIYSKLRVHSRSGAVARSAYLHIASII
jgi:DNA-binding CsgD family transcriptional regulator